MLNLLFYPVENYGRRRAILLNKRDLDLKYCFIPSKRASGKFLGLHQGCQLNDNAIDSSLDLETNGL